MKKLLALAAAFVAGSMLVSPAMAQTPASPGSPAPMATGAASAMPAAPAASALPAAARHLVYRFGYNTEATDQGRNTGTTTIDIAGRAKDGGVMVTATDDWWNQAKPRQTYTCELYPNGGVTCAQAPFAISPIQVAIVPFLAKGYFAALAGNPNASWTQTYNVRATFAPGASSGFAGQVHTWNCSYAMHGTGPLSSGSPLLVVKSKGSMKQQGGRYITANQQGNMAFDPRIHVPALVNEEFTFVPTMSVNKYAVQLKLIKVSPQ